MPKTHEQHDPPAVDKERNRRGADLCRRNPALWSRAVRYSDYLQARGVDRWEADDRAMAWAEGETAGGIARGGRSPG